VIYYTFCRFNCFNQLQARDFEDKGDSIQITFRRAKNDQMHNGSSTFLMSGGEDDPVEIVRLFFKLCGFRFGAENDDTSYVSPVIKKSKRGIWTATGQKRVGYSQATKELRRLIADLGIKSDKVTDKSVKYLGVTKSMAAGMTLEDAMHLGRWRTLSMPLHYKINSEQYKKEIAGQVPS